MQLELVRFGIVITAKYSESSRNVEIIKSLEEFMEAPREFSAVVSKRSKALNAYDAKSLKSKVSTGFVLSKACDDAT